MPVFCLLQQIVMLNNMCRNGRRPVPVHDRDRACMCSSSLVGSAGHDGMPPSSHQDLIDRQLTTTDSLQLLPRGIG